MTRLSICLPILAVSLIASAASAQTQVCLSGDLQLQHDDLPRNPTGPQRVAVIRGLCVGDRAAAVFDLRGLPGPIRIKRGGILFAGPANSRPAMATLEFYDGATFTSIGVVAPGRRLFQSSKVGLALNTLTSVAVTPSNLSLTTGILLVAWKLDTNPNGNCLTGYTANFASDTQLPPRSPCSTRLGTNLIFDSSQGWWDIRKFQIINQNWCGPAFNGNWVIRACVSLPTTAYRGTGEDLVLTSGSGSDRLGPAVAKSVKSEEKFTIAMRSPNGTFNQSPVLLLLEAFRTSGPPVRGLLPGLHVGTNFLAFPVGLPLGGVSFTIPKRTVDRSILFQGVALDPTGRNTRNGLFASTHANVAVSH